MSDESEAGSNESAGSASPAPSTVWQHLRNHKVLQWGVAYLGAALALAQAQDLLAVSFDWPAVVGRVVLIVLIVGLPIALTVAWYHGHRALRQVTPGELAILSVLLLIGGLFFTVAFRPAGESALPVQAANAAAEAAGSVEAPVIQDRSNVLPNKIAVLPCENLSPDPDDAHFATGLHQDIIWQLDKLQNLNPIPRRTVLPYAGTTLPIAEMAEQLDVRALLDCTVRYANDRIKITAELVDATGAQTLWQGEYEPSITELADVFQAQADIAMNIANAMSVVFTAEEFALLAKPPTVSPDAYVLVLRAFDEPGFERTEGLLREAITADPSYALPYAWLAAFWSVATINSNVGPAVAPAERAETSARVREYAERALELDPLVPFARSALTMDATLRWQWTEAYDRYARARDATPNDVMQYDIFLLSYVGRFEEAMEVAVRGAELFRGRAAAPLFKGFAFAYQGRYDEAAREFASVVNMEPGALLGRDFLIRTHIARGDEASALYHLTLSERIAASDRPVAFLPSWAYSYGRLGHAAEARRIFDEMRASEAAGTRFGAGGWAMAHLAVGDETRALEELRIAARKAREHEPDEGFFMLMELRMNVTNDDVLRKPEFVEALGRVRGD
jgi:TolB-like protein